MASDLNWSGQRKEVLNATNLDIEWIDIPVGDVACEQYGHPLATGVHSGAKEKPNWS